MKSGRDHVIVSPDGTNLAVRDHGGRGRDVLFLHGRSRSLADWPPVLAHLDGIRSVSMDLRWHGRSDVGGSVALPALLDDVDAIIGALGLERPVLVGHSLGGVIASYFASLRQSCSAAMNIDGLISLVPPAEGRPAPNRPPSHRGDDDGGDDSWREQEVARLRTAEEEFGVPDNVTRAFIDRAFVRGGDGRWHRRPPLDFYGLPLGEGAGAYVDALRRTTVPVLVLLCTGPPKTPSHRDAPLAELRRAMLEGLTVLAGEQANVAVMTLHASHAVIWEKSAEVAALIASLVRGELQAVHVR